MGFDALTLECFLAVADTGSFTRAAEKVGRTQSAVSQQISKLEDRLQKQLFMRTKNLALTPSGEIFLGYVQEILKLQREALDRFLEPELEGEVRFGVPEDFASVFLSQILTDFSRLHPRIFLNIECDLTLNLLERFKKREFDLVLVKISKPQDFPNAIDVWSETLEWVGKSVHFTQKETPIPLVLSPQPCVYRSRAINSLESTKRKWRIIFSSHSFASTIAAVRAGLGVTVLPRNMIPQDLQIIPKQEGIPQLSDTHISLLKHDETNPTINSLGDFVIKSLHPKKKNRI
ncbi:MAG: LysR substrate-binding domain-containing protein [Alphaproteobacteria bacterium]